MSDFGLLAVADAPVTKRPACRYLVTDLRNGARLGELPLSNVAYTDLLNQSGPLSASIDMATSGLDAISTTRPRRTALWAYRGNSIVWGGIIWQRQAAGRFLKISAQSFWSYIAARRLTVDAAADNDDQLTAVQALVQWALDQPGGDIGVTVGSETSGVLITQQFARSYELKPIGPLIEELAATATGFDFAVTVSEVADVPTARFTCWYPRRGRPASTSGVTFRFRRGPGGNLIDYTHTEDGLSAATTVYGLGAGDGTDMIITQAVRTSPIDDGYPLQEDVVSHRDITEPAVVLGLAEAAVAAKSETPSTWTLTVDPDDLSIPFGSWTVGDDVNLVIEDDWRFPAGANGEPGFEGQVRITGQTVEVPDDGGPEKVTLSAAEAYGA